MITLSAPCRALMDPEPLTVRPDDLLSDVADEVKEVHYRAAVAVDSRRHPIGLVTRTDLVSPRPGGCCSSTTPSRRRAFRASSRPRSWRSSTTITSARSRRPCPVRATFDPVGSTSTLVIERFRQNGMEPSRSSAVLLLGAILSDTVILNSPTTTERDRAAVEYLGRVLALDAMELGRELAHQLVQEAADRGLLGYELLAVHPMLAVAVAVNLDSHSAERLDQGLVSGRVLDLPQDVRDLIDVPEQGFLTPVVTEEGSQRGPGRAGNLLDGGVLEPNRAKQLETSLAECDSRSFLVQRSRTRDAGVSSS